MLILIIIKYLFVKTTINATVITHYLGCQDDGTQGFRLGCAGNCKSCIYTNFSFKWRHAEIKISNNALC